MALLQPRGKRSATVTAETDMDLLVLGSREFSSMVEKVPSVGRKVMAAVADRVRDAERGQTRTEPSTRSRRRALAGTSSPP